MLQAGGWGLALVMLGGCHLALPLTAGTPDGGADGPLLADGPADLTSDALPRVDSARPDSVGDALPRPADQAVPVESGAPPSWTSMSVTGPVWPATVTPSVWGVSSAEIYLSTGDQVFHCKDLSPAPSLDCVPVAAVGAGQVIYDLGGAGNEVYAVGQPNLILAKSQGWANVYTQADKFGFYSIFCTSATACVLTAKRLAASPCCTTGQLSNHTFNAAHDSTVQLNSAWRDSSSGFWATVGAGCTIGHYLAGASWIPSVPPGCSANLKGVWGQGTTALAVGSNGTRLRFDGVNWLITGTGGANLNAIWGADLSNVYAVGDSGLVRKYSGTGWSPAISGPFGSSDLSDIWGVSKDLIYVVGPDTKVFRYGP